MDFYEWVNSLEIINSPEGDLVGDIQRDTKFPKGIKSFEQLSNYLPDDGAVQEAAKNLFESYLAEKHHHK
ncbi:YozE family protein [Lactobacillus crispatus]|uniref:YozE family protein n=1 Tax=Lactobacillus crispatus TaxID=47770 RepID=UPI002805F676|nr:YozE family protein [uncultured Lactobacillus sp.]